VVALTLAYAALAVVVAVALRIAVKAAREREDATVSARLMDRLRSAADVRDAMEIVLGGLLAHLKGRAIVAVTHDRAQLHVHIWEARAAAGHTVVTHTQGSPTDADKYFFPAPIEPWRASARRGSKGHEIASQVLGAHDRLERIDVGLPGALLELHPFESLLVWSGSYGIEWTDRVFVIDAAAGARQLRFVDTVLRQASIVLHTLDVQADMHSRGGAAERARVARELHDGVIQSLIGLEMQVDVWRRSAENDHDAAASQLGHIQQMLRREILELRDLIQHMRPLAIDASHLLEYLADLAERFQRQTGIVAHFVSEVDEVELPAHICGEIARIVQEALVNVRKHSGARNVIVRVSAPDNQFKFEVDDDGQGFGFLGRYTNAELEVGRKGPVVIKERVRSIGGTLAIESAPGQGARVEVWVPREAHG
jgi:signal transduction histidine kinase